MEYERERNKFIVFNVLGIFALFKEVMLSPKTLGGDLYIVGPVLAKSNTSKVFLGLLLLGSITV